MRYIAHRGNINGKDLTNENNPYYIQKALEMGYDVEIDVWWENGYFLGHDQPTYEVGEQFLHQENMWIHAKNIYALYALHSTTNCFFHNIDDAVLTSKNFIWTYPTKELTVGSVCVLPEICNYSICDIKKCYGICSDFIERYKNV